MLRRLSVAGVIILLLGVAFGACAGRRSAENAPAGWIPVFGWFERDQGNLPDGPDEETETDPVGPEIGSETEGTQEPREEEPRETLEGANSVTKDTYVIDVDVTLQRVRIMRGDEVVKDMICSTGIEGKETPLGEFKIQNRGEWFFNDKYKMGAKYWVSFKDWGIYLFHSVAMDANKEIIPEEEAKLGTPASHGCVRLPVEDAKWIYDNIPAETKVVIHD
ncbi:MAG: L,D-transpeptidase [Bacillota bacterium]|jgi:lipoprotein-anchoring transpeptidase ErfK/SrfK